MLLHENEWNGENYSVKQDSVENVYTPIYRFNEKNIDLEAIEENSDEWDYAVEIIGFEI